ncbi:hypothetical protein SprV_0401453200 [Sparganum proliferum]
MLRQLQLRWNGYLAMPDDERLPKRLFYRNATTGDRRQGENKRHYKDILLTSLKEFKSVRTPEMISPRIDRSGEEQGRLEHQFTKSAESSLPKPKERLVNAANPQPQHPTNSNVSTTLSDIPRVDGPRRTSPGSMQQQYENFTYCLRDRSHRDRCCNRYDNHHCRRAKPWPFAADGEDDYYSSHIHHR